MSYRVAPFDWFLLACLVVSWGSSFAMSKIAVGHIDALWISALRLAIGAAFLFVIAIMTRQIPDLSFRTWSKYTWLGFSGNALPFFLITWGIQFVSSGVSGLMMGTIPVLILVLAHFFLPGERLNRFKSAGFLLGFIGLLILIDPRKAGDVSLGGSALAGELAIIGGCLCYAVHSISAKRLGFDRPFAQSFGVLFCGAVLGLVPALLFAKTPLVEAPASALLATVGLGIIPTGLATVVMYKLMERTSPTMVAQSNYLVPVYALIFGAVTLGETIGLNVIVALILILSGIFLSRMQSIRPLPLK